jgi:hypothetical protein
MIASSESRSGNEVPQRKCAPNFAACSHISGTRINNWNGPPNRPRRPETIKSCTRRWAGIISAGDTGAFPPVSAVDFPPIPPGSARIWFYRVYDPTESKGRPYICMNGAIVGISEQGYVFYRDVLAGFYHVLVESYGRDLFQFRDVALVPGQQAYVKILSLRSWVESGRNFSRDTFDVLIIPPTSRKRKFRNTRSCLRPSRSAL